MKNEMKTHPYIKPLIVTSKLSLTRFYDNSYTDAFDSLFNTEVMAQSGGGGLCIFGCLLPETLVLKADGKSVPITSIREGDTVVSFDLHTMKRAIGTVLKTYPHTSKIWEYLTINNALQITPNHAVYTTDNLWVSAGSLRKGDKLISPDGEAIEIVTIEKKQKETPVYDLRIDERYHNYFASGFLVHNQQAVK